MLNRQWDETGRDQGPVEGKSQLEYGSSATGGCFSIPTPLVLTDLLLCKLDITLTDGFLVRGCGLAESITDHFLDLGSL